MDPCVLYRVADCSCCRHNRRTKGLFMSSLTDLVFINVSLPRLLPPLLCTQPYSPPPPPAPPPVILPPHTSVEGHTDFFCICLPPFNTHTHTHTHVSAGALLKRAREDEEHRQTDLHSCSCFSSSLRAVYTVGKKGSLRRKHQRCCFS